MDGSILSCKFSVDDGGNKKTHPVGSTLRGHVDIEVQKSMSAEEVRVRLQGYERTSLLYLWCDGALYYQREATNDQPIVSIQANKTDESTTESIISRPQLMIRPGSHRVPFQVHIPTNNIPCSHEYSPEQTYQYSSNGEIKYLLLVEYKKPGSNQWERLSNKDDDAFTVLVTGLGDDLHLKPEQDSLHASDDIFLPGCCCKSTYEGKAVLDVSFEPSSVVLQHDQSREEVILLQPFKVSCQNTTPYGMTVYVYLNENCAMYPNPAHPEGQGYNCHGQEFSKTLQSEDFQWNLDGESTQVYEGQLRIPTSELSHSYSGTFLQVRHRLLIQATLINLGDGSVRISVCLAECPVEVAPVVVCKPDDADPVVTSSRRLNPSDNFQ